MLSTIAPLLVVAETHVELPVPPYAYGLMSLAAFAMGLGALFAFRQASTKIASKENTVEHGPAQDHEGEIVHGHSDGAQH